ncbi:MAG: hypothetical protein HZB83_00475 [Deltaproteobacteria bacterium]|nr:hypothetical protein [Deltaproteobacteria bacterium]
MRKTSLLHKALFAIVLILLPIFITFLHTYTVNKRRLSADILGDISVIAAMYQMEVNGFLETAQKRASDFSSDGYIRDRLKEITNGRQMSTPDTPEEQDAS